jgi:hypothetical protein
MRDYNFSTSNEKRFFNTFELLGSLAYSSLMHSRDQLEKSQKIAGIDSAHYVPVGRLCWQDQHDFGIIKGILDDERKNLLLKAGFFQADANLFDAGFVNLIKIMRHAGWSGISLPAAKNP